MENLLELDFSTNWNNKLSCDVFTSIRLKGGKYSVGNKYVVRLLKRSEHNAGYLYEIIKHAECISISEFKLGELKEWIARLDTGYSAKECKEIIQKMYSKKNIDWDKQVLVCCLFKTLKK